MIGPSGAGKTTTIRLMTGSLEPDDGVVRVLGEDPRKFRRRTRERIGYMPQLFVLYPDLTTRENVDFMAALFGIPAWRRGRRVKEVLELVDLTDARNRRASTLSGGMQRRLELACALVHRPDLLILDEPTAGIDPLLRTRVWSEFDRLRQSGVTILVTTQYVSEAEYCDAVALISEGQLVAYAPPDEMRKMAQGGEVFEVVDAASLSTRASCRRSRASSQIRQHGPSTLLVVAANAGLATPLVNDAIEKAGGDGRVQPRIPADFRRGLRRAGHRARRASSRAAAANGARRTVAAGDGATAMRELSSPRSSRFIRITAQVSKELIQVRRRPGAVISLVFGPFLIMAIFGLGYTGVHRPLDTVLVIPAEPAAAAGRRRTTRTSPGRASTSWASPSDAGSGAGPARRPSDRPGGHRPGRCDRAVPGRPAGADRGLHQRGGPGRRLVRRLPGERRDAARQRGDHQAGGAMRSYAVPGVPEFDIPPEVVAEPTIAQVTNVAPGAAQRRVLRRAGGVRADPAAHGGDADRAVVRARATVRRHGDVPHLAGQLVRAGARQVPRPGHR